MGVYLSAPRLREVDTELLVRAALGGGGAEEEDSANGGGANGGGGASTSASSANEEKEKESKMKRLFVPIVGDGPQEMCLVHLGEFWILIYKAFRGNEKEKKGRCLCSLSCRSKPLSLSLFSFFSCLFSSPSFPFPPQILSTDSGQCPPLASGSR